MLAKDIFALNDVDSKIQDVIGQLQELIEVRTDIASETQPQSTKSRRTGGSRGLRVDFSSIDLTLDDRGCGLKVLKSR